MVNLDVQLLREKASALFFMVAAAVCQEDEGYALRLQVFKSLCRSWETMSTTNENSINTKSLSTRILLQVEDVVLKRECKAGDVRSRSASNGLEKATLTQNRTNSQPCATEHAATAMSPLRSVLKIVVNNLISPISDRPLVSRCFETRP